MKMTLKIFLFFICFGSITGCQIATQGADAQTQESTVTPTTGYTDGWAEDSHSNKSEPDYETVFPQDEVNRIDITIEPENWEIMMADMTELMGEFGEGQGMGAG